METRIASRILNDIFDLLLKIRVSENYMVGLREQNKREKLERIKSSAKTIFLEKGFDEATTKEIAEHARVGTGTLFNYAADKRDLIFLIAADEIDDLVNRGFSDVPEDLPFLEQLIVVFRHHYQYYHSSRDMGLRLLRELPFYHFENRPQAKRFGEHYENFRTQLSLLVKTAIEQKKIEPDEDFELVTDVIFSLFSRELRRWLCDPNPEVEKGLFRLRRYFKLVISGLNPKSDAF
jgi:AcrR family transcriptional regulator